MGTPCILIVEGNNETKSVIWILQYLLISNNRILTLTLQINKLNKNYNKSAYIFLLFYDQISKTKEKAVPHSPSTHEIDYIIRKNVIANGLSKRGSNGVRGKIKVLLCEIY